MRLIGQVITVSLETMKVVQGLPEIQSRILIPRVITALSLNFGDSFNSSWQQIGLVDSLAVPITHEGRTTVLHEAASYLKTHPAAALPAQGITETALTELDTAYADALADVQDCESETTEAREDFDSKMQAGQVVLRGLIKELALAMSPTDARWKAFGFNIPGYPAAPEQVLNLIVTPGVARSLMLNWDASVRGARYLVELLDAAPESEWTLMTTVAETSVTLMDLVPGANVQLRVTAANDGGEAVPSEPVQAQVPMAAAA